MSSWFEKIINSIDWKGDYNLELKRIQQKIGEALYMPPDELAIGQETDGERLYWKLWNLAREERAKRRQVRIKEIAESKYSHLNLVRANALAALDYAKQIEQERDTELYRPNHKTVYAAKTAQRGKDAHDKNMRTYKNCTKGINNMINLDYSHLEQIQIWYGEEED